MYVLRCEVCKHILLVMMMVTTMVAMACALTMTQLLLARLMMFMLRIATPLSVHRTSNKNGDGQIQRQSAGMAMVVLEPTDSDD